ncbi:MAG: NADP oxidoreductase [Anaerolineaceae bacterium]|nr:NADP oxidoreductase [Anaerolineaceae bacterium]
MTQKPTLATVWLDGCSGCHMSLLDVDEFVIDLVGLVDIVYSPLVDMKVFPDMVDITLVEGAVSNEHDLHLIKHIRQHTRTLIAFGDCAVTGNIPAMHNRFEMPYLLKEVYETKATHTGKMPTEGVPPLLPKATPVHAVVPVEFTLPGCPPHVSVISYVLTELLAGRTPDLVDRAHFG